MRTSSGPASGPSTAARDDGLAIACLIMSSSRLMQHIPHVRISPRPRSCPAPRNSAMRARNQQRQAKRHQPMVGSPGDAASPRAARARTERRPRRRAVTVESEAPDARRRDIWHLRSLSRRKLAATGDRGRISGASPRSSRAISVHLVPCSERVLDRLVHGLNREHPSARTT